MTAPALPKGGLPGLCRECGHVLPEGFSDPRCPACGSPRLIRHAELDTLTIAHLDCDAFYASVEKRDDPSLRDKPVLIGGGKRGVVSAACYIARIYGCRSAMPMFKALKLCPNAVVIKPNMEKYSAVGRQVRALMLDTTPLVQPLSIDEAFLDLSGTERLHKGSPAHTLALLVRRIEQEIGITVSIGLSYNKFLAKIASDLDKPRGFAIVGRAEARDFLARQPVGLIWGVGQSLQARLVKDGITHIAQLQELDERTLIARYGAMGQRLFQFARGIDARTVEPERETKSISAETTFDDDIADLEALRAILWLLSEKLVKRLKAEGFAAAGITLKLKTADFRLLTRSRRLDGPTLLAERLYRSALPLLEKEATGTAFRLIGIGASALADPADADPPDLVDPDRERQKKIEGAMDAVRKKLGDAAILKGRGFPGKR
ncbi:MAG: DNA polymerase IV [Oceanibaculum nanhaiense]|jgi:DNA polymerase-4|uniref:DNA polymerase IV n=1 Tax=Oceanibaculum nanhaiense TaxID=1909734 RepID=UPI0032EAAC66